MIDCSASQVYRTLELNSATLTPPAYIGGGIEGIQVEQANLSDVDVVQYVEKRALADGMDSGDLFLGARRLQLQGSIYGLSRGKFYDFIRDLRRAFSPKAAELEGSDGFLPYTFSVPTDDIDNYPTRVIPLKLYVAPRSLTIVTNRDRQGGKAASGLSVPWQATLVGKDPLIYAVTPKTNTTPGFATNWTNLGDFPGIPSLTLVVGSAAGTVTVTIGTGTLTITVPAGAVGRIFRYDGATKLLTLDSVNRMDLMGLTPVATHPLVPLGSSSSSAIASGATITSMTLSFTEAYA